MTVKEIIDRWDPISLLPFAPADEYAPEIAAIEAVIGAHTDTRALADELYRIFAAAFGADVFGKAAEDCIPIAQQLLEKRPAR